MTDKKRAEAAVALLKEIYPEAICSLEAGHDPWRLLVMARLSAQCTDERVNQVCVHLFRRFPTCEAMAKGELERIEELVRPCGLYKMKAKNIRDASIMLLERFGGRIPDTMDELLSLPGVGRKIANLILGDAFGKGGIVADTHCIRICGRLGFYEENRKDPLFTERVMTPLIPKSEQSDFCHRIVMFGRDVCTARSPKCESCPLCKICKHNLQK